MSKTDESQAWQTIKGADVADKARLEQAQKFIVIAKQLDKFIADLISENGELTEENERLRECSRKVDNNV